MLSFTEAQRVQEYIKQNLFLGMDSLDKLISVQSIACTPPVCQLDPPNAYHVLAFQFSDMTIMVRIEKTQKGLKIHEAKTVKW